MTNQTQVAWVKERLYTDGYISRNECLRNYISRLGAIINHLKKEGYLFTGEYKKTTNGKDYIYKMINSSAPHFYEK